MGNIEGMYRRTCILLSGGVGRRMNTTVPKQYIEINGVPVIGHTLCRLVGWKAMDSLIVVADKEWHEYISGFVKKVTDVSDIVFLGYAEPGTNRQLSILNALNCLRDKLSEDAYVMIHDAVRPMVSDELLLRCDRELGDCDGVMPCIPVKDTVYKSVDGVHIAANMNRNELYAGQTPEFFRYRRYLEANKALTEEELLAINGSTEPAVAYGMNMVMVQGEESNYKITTMEDLKRFRYEGDCV